MYMHYIAFIFCIVCICAETCTNMNLCCREIAPVRWFCPSDCNCVTLRSHFERIFVDIGPGVRNLKIVGHLKVHLMVHSIEQLTMCDVPGVLDIEWGEQNKRVCDLSTRTSSVSTRSTTIEAVHIDHITSSVSAEPATTIADQITLSVSTPSVSLEPTTTTLHPSTAKASTTPSYLDTTIITVIVICVIIIIIIIIIVGIGIARRRNRETNADIEMSPIPTSTPFRSPDTSVLSTDTQSTGSPTILFPTPSSSTPSLPPRRSPIVTRSVTRRKRLSF